MIYGFILRQKLAWAAVLLLASASVAHSRAEDGAAPSGPSTKAPAEPGPSQLIQTTAEHIFAAIRSHPDEYRRDPSKLRDLVDRVLLPHVDSGYAARLVLGRYWREASVDERRRFAAALYDSILNQYSTALLDFSNGRLKVFPYRGDPGARYASVRTQVRKADGSLVNVEYSLRWTPDGWKVWDVVIEGISYVKSLRDDVGEQIAQEGLNRVITRLESGNARTPGRVG